MAQTPRDPNMMTSPMFSFVRAHWYASIKAVILYIILYLIIFSFTDSTAVRAVESAVSLIAWLFFDYSDTYKKAMRDVNVVKYGDLEYDKLRGLKSGLLAQIPGLIIVILIFATKGAADYNDLFRVLYFILYAPTVQWIAAAEEVTMLVWLLPLLLVPVVSQIAYYCGYNGLGGRVINRIMYRGRGRKKH